MGRGRRRGGGRGSASASGRKRPLRAIEEEEEEADTGEDLTGEDYCFVCKDGGALRVCDFRSCNKAYHPGCVGKDSNFLTSDEEFICEWHACFICKGRSRYYCFCCPWHAFCNGCVAKAEFVPVLRKTKGFCINCLRMAIMIEKNIDVDSDGEMADFSDRETYEFLFKEYWEIVKDKEGLTLEMLEEAYAFMKNGLNCKQADLEKVPDEERNSDSDFMGNSDDADDELCSPSYSNGASKKIKTFLKEGRPKKNGHMDWGSEALMEFLSSVGKDITITLDQFGAAQVVKEYIRQNDLLQKDKKKLVTCDDKLKSLFRKSKLRYNRICSLLKKHITSNMASEDEAFVSSDDNNDSAMRKKSCTANFVSSTSKRTSEIDKRCFASLESDNIKLVYLKRSLVMNLLKERDSFESKVTGCFVRVKVDPKDYIYPMHKKSHQLGQVTGIKISEVYKIRDISTDVHLRIFNMYDVRISMLSDEDFEKDECEDLLLLAQKGSFKRPTVGELEVKARSMHREIVSHGIDKEIQILEKLIDMAHEKGWRSEMYAYMDKKKLLCQPSERQRCLEEVPKVIPDMKDSKDIELQVPTQDKSIQNNTVAFQATKEDADGGTVGMNVQKQDTEDTEANAAGDIPCAPKQDIPYAPKQKSEATKADASGDTSATRVQWQITEANKSNAAGDTLGEFVQKKDDEATKADANGDTSAIRVQWQITEANKSKDAGDTLGKFVQKKDDEATKADANGDTSATRVQWKITEANKSKDAGATLGKFVQKKDGEATKADANGDTSATRVQWQITEANKSNTAGDTLGKFVQKKDEGKFVQKKDDEAIDAGMKTQVIIDLEADENQHEGGGQTAIIDLESDDARDAHPVQHETSNTFQRRGISLRKCVWYYIDPQGEEQGPFTMELLRRWWDSGFFPEDFKVWRKGQTSDSAVFLRDVL